MKTCSKCSVAKPETDFSPARGIRAAICKQCAATQAQVRYHALPEQKKALLKLRNAKWRRTNPEKVTASRRKWERNNRETKARRSREYRCKNRPRLRVEARARYYANRERYIKACVARARERYRCDPMFRILHTLRNRPLQYLKGQTKSDSTRKLLGCSPEELRIYLESKFEPGMTWENHGRGPDKWHIDHIIPCATFDLSKREHQRRCFHFSNLRPLWETDNLRKGAKVLTNQFQLI